MTKAEFEAWKQETAKSADRWQVDLIHNKPEDTIMFKGGENGHFMSVRGKTVTMGTYEGAIPHIGDAIFKPTGVVVCKSNQDAWTRLLEKAGLPWLRELFS